MLFFELDIDLTERRFSGTKNAKRDLLVVDKRSKCLKCLRYVKCMRCLQGAGEATATGAVVGGCIDGVCGIIGVELMTGGDAGVVVVVTRTWCVGETLFNSTGSLLIAAGS